MLLSMTVGCQESVLIQTSLAYYAVMLLCETESHTLHPSPVPEAPTERVQRDASL